jgi:hypothetical protein
MRRKHEVVNGHRISCWDDGPNTIERYTVVFLDDAYIAYGRVEKVPYLAMSASPFNGFCHHGEMPLANVAYLGRGGVFTKRIAFKDLSEDCQKAVLQDLEPEHIIEECGCCGMYHPKSFGGDCRDDANRYESDEDYAERNNISVNNVMVFSLEEDTERGLALRKRD